MNIKKSLVAVLATVTAFSSFAGVRVQLTRSESIRTKPYRNAALEKVVEVPAGTIVEYAVRDRLGLPSGTPYINDRGFVSYSRGEWKRVINIDLQRGSLSHLPQWKRQDVRQTVKDINDFGAKNLQDERSGDDAYFISASAVERTGIVLGGNHGGTVIVDAPDHGGYNNGGYGQNDGSYQKCFQEKYQVWETTNEAQKRQGQNNTAIGVGIGILGAIVGQNNEDLGNVIMAGGAILATVGLVQMSQATQLNTYYGDVSCRTYYRPVRTRVPHRIQGQYCETTEYQSTSWNSTVYYYESRCGNREYVRYSKQQWYY